MEWTKLFVFVRVQFRSSILFQIFVFILQNNTIGTSEIEMKNNWKNEETFDNILITDVSHFRKIVWKEQ